MLRRILQLIAVLTAIVILVCPSISFADAPTSPPHYVFGRPIPNPYVTVPQYGFPYGWDRNGASPIHHGVDFLNRRGVPVIAAGEGTVYYAGPDTDMVFGPYPNFYGNVVVIEHPVDAPEGGRLFTLYGHLETVTVASGQ